MSVFFFDKVMDDSMEEQNLDPQVDDIVLKGDNNYELISSCIIR